MWVVTVHDGGGSMVEAADPEIAISVANFQDAKALSDTINNLLPRLGRSLMGDDLSEVWSTFYELTPVQSLPKPGADVDVPGAGGDQIAIDIGTYLAKWIKERYDG